MVNLPNLNAETGADLIADDAQPAVTFKNTGTGPGLRAYGIVVTSGASIDLLFGNSTYQSNVTEGVVAAFNRGVIVSSPTVSVISVGIGSAASAPVFELREQSFVSVTTILTTTGATSGSGAVRVKYGDNYGWIPIFPTGSVTAAAR